MRGIIAPKLVVYRLRTTFNTHWEVIQTMANQDAPQVPTLTKTNQPLRRRESFKNVCYNTFRVRKAPLLYIIRENVEVTQETEMTLLSLMIPTFLIRPMIHQVLFSRI